MEEMQNEINVFQTKFLQLVEKYQLLENKSAQQHLENQALLEENQTLRSRLHTLETELSQKIEHYGRIIDDVLTKKIP